MNIKGYAFEPNENELHNRNSARYSEIKHLTSHVGITRNPKYGGTEFRGECTTEESSKLSEFDLALLADNGNLCFGGYCEKNGNRFYGAYYTD